MKYAKFEEVTPARFGAQATDIDSIVMALVEENRVQSAAIVRLIWAVMIIGTVVFVPIVNHYLLPLLRG